MTQECDDETPTGTGPGPAVLRGPVSRRRAIGLGCGLMVGLAGCSGDGGDSGDDAGDDGSSADGEDGEDGEDGTGSDDGTDGETDGNDGTSDDGEADNEQAQQRYDEAIAKLVTNAERFDELKTDAASPSQANVDTIGQRLDTAETALAEAESMASGELAARISNAQVILDFQRTLNEYYSAGVSFNVHFQAAFENWQAGDFDAAITEFEAAQEASDNARAKIAPLENKLDQIDQELIDAPALDYTGEVWDHVAADGYIDFEASDALTSGVIDYVEALDGLVDGQEAYRAENYEQARSAFEAALATAQSGLETFQSLEENPDAPADMVQTATAFKNELAATVEALGMLVDAAQLALDGNVNEADSLYEDALDTLPQ